MSNIKSVYIHIPFCKVICSYCDFCKIYYNKKYINNYLDALEKEIKNNYKNEYIKTVYIGGGTPSSLDIEELTRLFNIVKLFKLEDNYEFTIESNIEDLNFEKLKLYYRNNVNRLSIGIQSFNQQHLKLLNRNHNDVDIFKKIKVAKEIGFNNISIDLIYAIPGQVKEELQDDLNKFIDLDINHISTYSLIIEPNTLLHVNKVEYIDEDNDFEMYELIKNTLNTNDFIQYEISNYAKSGYESKHNLTYWNNNEYYGFGMGASGYIGDIRYGNNLNINNYINGIYRVNEEQLSANDKIENELILGLRKIKGINKKDFYNKYNIDILKITNVKKLIKEGKLIDNGDYIYISEKYMYISNDILIDLMV